MYSMIFAEKCDIIYFERSYEMKKVFFINFVLFFTSLCFAIPNIKLYENAQFVCQIKDGKIYYDEEFFFDIRGNELYQADEYIGTITENEDKLLLDFYSEGNLKIIVNTARRLVSCL